MIITDSLNGIIVTLEVVLQLFRGGGGDYTQVIIGSTLLFQNILQNKMKTFFEIFGCLMPLQVCR